MSQTAEGLGALFDSPLPALVVNLMAALLGALFVILVTKTLARTMPGFAVRKAGREIQRASVLAARLRERDPTRMLIALIVRQFSIYIVLSVLATAAAVACLAARGSHFDGWFPAGIAALVILFQKTHEHYTRASEILQMKQPGIGPIEARVRTFFLAMTPEQQAAVDERLVRLRAEFDSLVSLKGPAASTLPPAPHAARL